MDNSPARNTSRIRKWLDYTTRGAFRIASPFRIDEEQGAVRERRECREWFLMASWEKLEYAMTLGVKILVIPGFAGLLLTLFVFTLFPSLENTPEPMVYSISLTASPIIAAVIAAAIRFVRERATSLERGESEKHRNTLEKLGRTDRTKYLPDREERIQRVLFHAAAAGGMLLIMWIALR